MPEIVLLQSPRLLLSSIALILSANFSWTKRLVTGRSSEHSSSGTSSRSCKSRAQQLCQPALPGASLGPQQTPRESRRAGNARCYWRMGESSQVPSPGTKLLCPVTRADTREDSLPYPRLLSGILSRSPPEASAPMPAQSPEQQPCKRQREVCLSPAVPLRGAAQTDSFWVRLAPAALASLFLRRALASDCTFFWLPIFPRAPHCFLPSLHAAASSGGHTFRRTAVDKYFSSLAASSESSHILRVGLRRPKERKRRPSLAGQAYRALGSWTRRGKDSAVLAPVRACEAGRAHLSSQSQDKELTRPFQMPLPSGTAQLDYSIFPFSAS